MLSACRLACSCIPCVTFFPKDYDGTLHQIAALGYREVEAAGFFGHTPPK